MTVTVMTTRGARTMMMNKSSLPPWGGGGIVHPKGGMCPPASGVRLAPVRCSRKLAAARALHCLALGARPWVG